MSDSPSDRIVNPLPHRKPNAASLRFATLLIFLLVALTPARPQAAEPTWQSALGAMPLIEPTQTITRTNFSRIMLESFRSNHIVKALVLQPGATDEFYFFKRAEATLRAGTPTLLDAVTALTNQTRIRVTFRPPMLLLHADDDPTEPQVTVRDPGLVERLRQTPFLPHFLYNDHDWDHVQPILCDTLDMGFFPPEQSRLSWHFFRHAVAGWDLNGWEALQAISLANKTVFTVRRSKVFRRPFIVFEGDVRDPGGKSGEQPTPVR